MIVPSRGSVVFGSAKNCFLALLGIRVAEVLRSRKRRVQNIETANAVEALGCWLAMLSYKGARDPRLRGTKKLRGKSGFSFSIARKPGFYVTQPMRQATVQSLRAFGFVESTGERFNSYACTKIGEEFIEAVCDLNRPFNRRVLDHLVIWAIDGHDAGTSAPLTNVLSPLTAMPKRACQILRHQLVAGSGTDPRRRQQALAWVEELRGNDKTAGSWKKSTKTIEEDHWHDLQAGGYFFQTRDAAIRLLEGIEVQLAKEKAASRRFSLDSPLSKVVLRLCNELRKCAEAFHRYGYDPSPCSWPDHSVGNAWMETILLLLKSLWLAMGESSGCVIVKLPQESHFELTRFQWMRLRPVRKKVVKRRSSVIKSNYPPASPIESGTYTC